MSAVAIAAALLTFGASAASATTWYVDPAGNDGNSCLSSSDACKTINAAIGKASSGDDIKVAAGTYSESVNISKSLTLNGAQQGIDARTRGGAESIIDSACSPVQINADNVTLDGFTVQGSTQLDPCTIAGIWMNPGGFGFQGGVQIVNNIVQNNIAGIEFDNSGAIPAKVQYNLIRNNNVPGRGSGNGIETNFGLVNATIDSNTFIGQMNSSIVVEAPASSVVISKNTLDTGIALFASTGITIDHNTSIGNTVSGTIYLGGGDSNVTVSNNVLDNGVEAVVVENAFGGPNSLITVSPNNCIAGNSTNGLRVASGGYTGSLNAINNWWGASSGPNYNGAGPGTGDKITDPDHVVTYTPFMTSPGVCCQNSNPGCTTNKKDCQKFVEQEEKNFNDMQKAQKKSFDATHPTPAQRKAFEDMQKADKDSFQAHYKAEEQQCKQLPDK